MDKKLVLYDIDGILIKKSRYSVTADRLIEKHFGLDSSKSKIPHEGKTYRRIFVETLKALGVENPEAHEKFEIALKDASPLAELVSQGLKFEKVDNVESLVKDLISQGHVIGLLTGNTYELARIKLGSAGLWKYFHFGAFGAETLIRGELVPIAIREAEKETGIKFSKRDVFVIGDTPLDVECAKYGGVKSIAVATGSESFGNLKKEKPDYVFKDFSDINLILEAINR